ncbi:carbamoyltransferase [Capnocytophaga sp. oral taxon 338 str. F0234]|jgi:hypothetical protein|nr:carbamoyltransferase [Capnocytophaga sp. oral taxon 338 str. F0234]
MIFVINHFFIEIRLLIIIVNRKIFNILNVKFQIVKKNKEKILGILIIIYKFAHKIPYK